VKLLVTGARGFLGWRAATLLRERGHDVIALARPGGRARSLGAELEPVALDAGDPAARRLVEGCDAVLHFAGVPDPAKANADPAEAVRANAGTTLNLLEGCADYGGGLLYPSTVRAALDPPPDVYALSKRLGEDTCALHAAHATVLRLTSVFGPGQIAREGATGAVAAFAGRALAGLPIVIPGNPERTRDFVYVDDAVGIVESLVARGRWDQTLTLASGAATPLRRLAELVRDAAGSRSAIETPGGRLATGEDESYEAAGSPELAFQPRPLEEAIALYVDWLRRSAA
jgi:UDP-glucose 4-epimerase